MEYLVNGNVYDKETIRKCASFLHEWKDKLLIFIIQNPNNNLIGREEIRRSYSVIGELFYGKLCKSLGMNIEKLNNKQRQSLIYKYKTQFKIIKKTMPLYDEYELGSFASLSIVVNNQEKVFSKLMSDLVDETIEMLKPDKNNLEVIERKDISPLKSIPSLEKFISTNKTLIAINKNRQRNFAIFDSQYFQIVYDVKDKCTKTCPKIPFSDFEHDTNRIFAEAVCKDFVFNFENKKELYLHLLSHDKTMYHDQMAFVNGEKIPSIEETIALISLLARLTQQAQFGPISTFKKQKLCPALILKNNTSLVYLEELAIAYATFAAQLTTESNEIKKITNLNFSDADTLASKTFSPLTLLSNEKGAFYIQGLSRVSTNKIHGNIHSQNYLESFFRKICSLKRFSGILPFYNSEEELTELIEYAKRYRSSSSEPDFVIENKIRGIIFEKKKNEIELAVNEVYSCSKDNSYSKKVASWLIDRKENMIDNFINLYFIFRNQIDESKQDFKKDKLLDEQALSKSHYNNAFVSIASDMHFQNLKLFEKENFSSNLNIVAGDFIDNLYHRGNKKIDGTIDIGGFGVLGNHDIFLTDEPSKGLAKEINTGFKKSIEILNGCFPNIKILNDEIVYQKGVAIIGMTLCYDINENGRTFFANKNWGAMFNFDDYIRRAKSLLNEVPKDKPIIFITHSPFKEYAVCKNKSIGVPSNWIFDNYPNVKMYIHGHGHSNKQQKIIKGITCITNPVVLHRNLQQMVFSAEEINEILKM